MDAEEAYGTLEKIIVNGFLTAEIRSDGVYFVMKNMTDRESQMLDFFRDSKVSMDDVSCKLSMCTFSIDGESFVSSRSESIPILMDFWSSVSVSLVSSASGAIRKVNERYYDVLRFLEGFCYTEKSRYLWRVYRESGLMGIQGAMFSGMNAVQENWSIINRELDSEEDYTKQFNLSLMVASSLNAKGAKVIARNFETNRNEMVELRKEIAKWGYDKRRVEEEKKKADWTTPIRSREDLVRELYRQMRGEKDKHDLFIDKWMQKQRERLEQMKKAALERSQKWREKASASASSVSDDEEESRRATPEEIKKFSSGKGLSGASKYMSAYEGLEKNDRFMRKIGAKVIGE
jgi:hypothetical protein